MQDNEIDIANPNRVNATPIGYLAKYRMGWSVGPWAAVEAKAQACGLRGKIPKTRYYGAFSKATKDGGEGRIRISTGEIKYEVQPVGTKDCWCLPSSNSWSKKPKICKAHIRELVRIEMDSDNNQLGYIPLLHWIMKDAGSKTHFMMTDFKVEPHHNAAAEAKLKDDQVKYLLEEYLDGCRDDQLRNFTKENIYNVCMGVHIADSMYFIPATKRDELNRLVAFLTWYNKGQYTDSKGDTVKFRRTDTKTTIYLIPLYAAQQDMITDNVDADYSSKLLALSKKIKKLFDGHKKEGKQIRDKSHETITTEYLNLMKTVKHFQKEFKANFEQIDFTSDMVKRQLGELLKITV